MPKAPVQTEVAKSNAFITKTISKTLLTPCRQVGLSRKKKTPTSSNLNYLENSLNLSESDLGLETTPVNSYLVKDTQEETPISTNLQKKDKKKTRVSKRLIEDDDECPIQNIKQIAKKIKKITSFEEINEEPTPNHQKETVFKDGETDTEHITPDQESETLLMKQNNKSRVSPRKRIKRLISDEESLENINLLNENKKSSSIDSKIFEDSVDVEKPKDSSSDRKSKKKRVSPRNSNKKVDSIYVYESSDDDDTPILNKKNLKVYSNKLRNHKENSRKSNNNDFQEQLDKTQKTTLQTNKNVESLSQKKDTETKKPLDDSAPKNRDDGLLHNSSKTDRKSKKLKRCLSMKKSSEDQTKSKVILRECSITLSPLDNKCNIEEDLITISEISSSEVKKLENEVKQKKKLIEELKQAEIYKKKHDIKELDDLTRRWKTGCIQALNDLLPQLQNSCDLNMETLLKKLNIPKDKIELSENGELV